MTYNLVVAAISSFGELFDGTPTYQQKELLRLMLQEAVVSGERLELALYAKPHQVNDDNSGVGRSETSNWLPGLASQSVVLWDRVCLEGNEGRRTVSPCARWLPPERRLRQLLIALTH